MKIETLVASSYSEVAQMVADWKAAHPTARIVSQDPPHNTYARNLWRVRITYDEPAPN